MKNKIFLHEPTKLKNNYQLIKNELIKNNLVIGNNIGNFRNEIININKAKFCSLVSSGTAALHLSLFCNQLDENCEVLLPAISFIASLNAILYTKANPIFIDVDTNLNLNIQDLCDFLEKNTFQDKKNRCINKKTKKHIKCILLIHVFGNIVDYSKVLNISRKKNISIVEDAAESFGSYVKIKNKKFFSGSFGRFACFSFNGNKIISSAGGGAVLSNLKKDQSTIDHYSNQAKSNSITFQHNDIGFNYRLSNIHATIGFNQARSFRSILSKKKLIFENYNKYLDKNLFKTIKYDTGANYWLIVIKIFKEINTVKLTNYMNLKNIEIRPVWYPLHLQKYTNKYQKYNLKNASSVYKKYICLPSSTSLTESKIKFICNSLKDYF